MLEILRVEKEDIFQITYTISVIKTPYFVYDNTSQILATYNPATNGFNKIRLDEFANELKQDIKVVYNNRQVAYVEFEEELKDG